MQSIAYQYVAIPGVGIEEPVRGVALGQGCGGIRGGRLLVANFKVLAICEVVPELLAAAQISADIILSSASHMLIGAPFSVAFIETDIVAILQHRLYTEP